MLTKLEKFWLWAAMHHPRFHECSVTLNPPLISIRINFGEYCSHEIFGLDIRFYRSELSLNIPYYVACDYALAMQKQGIYVDVDGLYEDIPF